MKKILRIITNVLTAIIIAIVLLLLITIFPITGNYKVLVVQSGSMEPAIHTGSIVIVKPTDNYKIGDIITFGKISRTQAPTTHRIHDMKLQEGNPVYITKGDANNAPDTKEVLPEDIAGKVLFSIPYAGYVISAAQKPIGFAMIIILPALFIVYDEIRKIINEAKKMIKKKKGDGGNEPGEQPKD